MTWANDLRIDVPNGAAQGRAVLDDSVKTALKGFVERLNRCGYWPLTGTQLSDANVGKIRKIVFQAPLGTDPTVAAGECALYPKTVTKTELFFAGQQLTKAGHLNVLATDFQEKVDEDQVQLTNNNALKAANAAGTGEVDLIKASVAGVPVLGANCTIASVPTADAGVENKEGVDDAMDAYEASIASTWQVHQGWSSKSAGVVYQATYNGIVRATGGSGIGYSGSSVATLTQRETGSEIQFPVKKGEYWKVVGATAVSIFEMY